MPLPCYYYEYHHLNTNYVSQKLRSHGRRSSRQQVAVYCAQDTNSAILTLLLKYYVIRVAVRWPAFIQDLWLLSRLRALLPARHFLHYLISMLLLGTEMVCVYYACYNKCFDILKRRVLCSTCVENLVYRPLVDNRY